MHDVKPNICPPSLCMQEKMKEEFGKEQKKMIEEQEKMKDEHEKELHELKVYSDTSYIYLRMLH